MGIKKIFNYKKLSEKIFTAGQPLQDELDSLIKEEFDVVIFLAFLEGETGVPEEKELLENAGIIFENIPVEWENPLEDDFNQFVQAMKKHEQKKMFIHCEANMRVSVFMALYRITQQGWSYEQAMADVYDIWKPNPIWLNFMEKILDEYKDK